MTWDEVKTFREELDALPTAPDGPPMMSREECERCGGRGYTGRHTHDPQQSTADECELCEGQGLYPPLDEPA